MTADRFSGPKISPERIFRTQEITDRHKLTPDELEEEYLDSFRIVQNDEGVYFAMLPPNGVKIPGSHADGRSGHHRSHFYFAVGNGNSCSVMTCDLAEWDTFIYVRDRTGNEIGRDVFSWKAR